MTEKEFYKKLRKAYKWNSLVFYLIAIALFVGGIYWAAGFSQYWERSLLVQKVIIALGPSCFLLYSMVICWRLPRQYITEVVHSNKPITEKQRIVEDYLSTLGHQFQTIKDNIIEVDYWSDNNFWFRYGTHLTIYYDEAKFLVHARLISLDDGFGIDFGVRNKKSRLRATQFIKANL